MTEQDIDYQRGPWPPVEVPEHVKLPDPSPCFGCAKPLTEKDIRIRHAKKHPVCNDCYLRGDYSHMTCTVCGQLRRRTEPGKTSYTCSRHQEEQAP
ncbi:hypothetical protein [Nesterenkonia sp.]|uniref:hypothetical protein n=1 Tax=Nesterenkonia sp. TaxID=704201 RepID=UPI00261CF7EE|nr:hypothetical protein [Nesterenkonia sp.]